MTIDLIAADVAREYGFDPEMNDVRELVANVGGRVSLLDAPDERQLIGGSLTINGPRDFDIYLSPITGRLRDNFTIAHELGHYFLHSGTPPGSKAGQFGRYGDNGLEREANKFAASLLMPRERFRQLMDQFGRSPAILASCFDVSPRAAEVRLSSLG
jgi:hypothetical protein